MGAKRTMNATIVDYKSCASLVEEALKHPNHGGRGGKWRRVLHRSASTHQRRRDVARHSALHPESHSQSSADTRDQRAIDASARAAERIVAKRRSRMGSCAVLSAT